MCLAASAEQHIDRRVQIALSVFPRIVAVDMNFRSKLLADGSAYLVFLYVDQPKKASLLSNQLLMRIDNLAGTAIRSEPQNLAALSSLKSIPTALFLTQKFHKKELEQILAYAADKHILVFSPFVGDVERGISAGIQVSNRVRPYFNVATLRKSQLEINSVLMGMSKKYE